MAVTDWKSPGTVASDSSFGTTTWDNVNNTKLEDGNTASNTYFYSASGDAVYGYIAKLVINNSVTGDNLGAEEAPPYSLTYESFGGSSQLWGNSLDSSKINGETFGFVISYKNYGATTYTEYLKTTNYGFSVPVGATIDGVEVRVKHKATPLEYGDYPEVDHIQIRVYYTESTTPTVGVRYPLPAFKNG